MTATTALVQPTGEQLVAAAQVVARMNSANAENWDQWAPTARERFTHIAILVIDAAYPEGIPSSVASVDEAAQRASAYELVSSLKMPHTQAMEIAAAVISSVLRQNGLLVEPGIYAQKTDWFSVSQSMFSSGERGRYVHVAKRRGSRLKAFLFTVPGAAAGAAFGLFAATSSGGAPLLAELGLALSTAAVGAITGWVVYDPNFHWRTTFVAKNDETQVACTIRHLISEVGGGNGKRIQSQLWAAVGEHMRQTELCRQERLNEACRAHPCTECDECQRVDREHGPL